MSEPGGYEDAYRAIGRGEEPVSLDYMDAEGFTDEQAERAKQEGIAAMGGLVVGFMLGMIACMALGLVVFALVKVL